jgi:hypothetical protein
MNIEPTTTTSTDRATNDVTPPIPTTTEHATTEHAAAEHVTAREIADLLRELAALRRGASDPSERARFLACKAELMGRLAPDPAHAPSTTAPDRRIR